MLIGKAITHRYGTQTVLQNVDISLLPGQRIGLMGPSGCGKTTLLRIVLGLLEPTQGEVRNDFLKTAAVFQESRLLPWCTALENVNLILGDRADTLTKAKQALARMELTAAADRYPRELSGGMQQRLAIARALALEGDLLVLDEPFKGLDDALRDRVIREVDKTQAAVLLVTHDAEEAKALDCEIISL